MPGKVTDQPAAHLVLLNGPRSGQTHPIQEGVLTVGRDPGNRVLPDGDRARTVSARHLEIRRTGKGFLLVDLGSTNGTRVDGERVDQAYLKPGMVITLGADGPAFEFRMGEARARRVEETQVVDPARVRTRRKSSERQEALLQEAVGRVRSARRSGKSGQTMMIMREALGAAVERSSRKFKVIIAGLIAALVGVSGWAVWRGQSLGGELDGVDLRIGQIEAELGSAVDPGRVHTLIQELNDHQQRALAIERHLLYQLGSRNEEQDFIEDEIRKLMHELGAEQYSIPAEFRDRVEAHINRFRGPDRSNVERALIRERDKLELIRSLLEKGTLPPDLAYMVLVETAFRMESVSSAGAAGPWQFVPATARAYGLTVNDEVDERFDISKSTAAACRYIRHLILDFGSGSSVMLALAAYNYGPAKIKRVIRSVEDPIRQRSFWYLYRSRALPKETREYIPRLVAAILIGRNPDRFGFS